MSYILEALKKSQLERELGRVPTLDTAGLFEEDKVEPGRGPWVPLALGLAAVALSIALYAVLRVPPAPQSATPESTRVQTPVPPAPVGIQMGKDPAGMGQTETGRMSHGDAAGRAAALGPQAQAAADSRILALPSGVSPPPGFGSASSVAGGYRIPDLPATPLVEPPPPKGSRLAPVGAPPETFGSGSAPNLGDARSEADLDAEIQRELERHLAEDMAAAAAAAPLLPDETPSDQVPTPVPADLIAEIESFKKQLKGESPRLHLPPKGRALSRRRIPGACD